MKNRFLLFIALIFLGNTIYAQSVKYFKSIEGSTDYPVEIKGKFEISPADTLLFRDFYRLTFKNNKMYHECFPKKQQNTGEIRFTKVLTKYSTEYNNSLFIQKLCQFNFSKTVLNIESRTVP